MLVQALVPEPAVEALHEGVLGGLSGRDVVPFHALLLLPAQDRVTGQFGAIVADDHTGPSPLLDEMVEFTSHAHPRQRGVDHDGQGLTREVVDHAQRAEAPPVDESVGDEVEAPAMVRRGGQQDRPPRSHRPLAPASSTYRQAFLTVDPEDLLGVRTKAFAFQQDAQPAIAEPAPFTGQIAQPCSLGVISLRTLLVLEGRPIQLCKGAGPTFAQAVLGHHVMHGLAFNVGRQKFFAAMSFSAALSSVQSLACRQCAP